MPGYLTDYANNKTLDLFFGAAAYSAPVTLYLGLSTGVANKSGSVSEPGSGAYARVAVTNNSTNFPAASAGVKANGTLVTFPTPTGSWGTILSVFVADAATFGNVLAMADLVSPSTPATGTAPKIAIGALHLQTT